MFSEACSLFEIKKSDAVKAGLGLIPIAPEFVEWVAAKNGGRLPEKGEKMIKSGIGCRKLSVEETLRVEQQLVGVGSGSALFRLKYKLCPAPKENKAAGEARRKLKNVRALSNESIAQYELMVRTEIDGRRFEQHTKGGTP